MRILPFKTPFDRTAGQVARFAGYLTLYTYVHVITSVRVAQKRFKLLTSKEMEPDQPAYPDEPFPFNDVAGVYEDPIFSDEGEPLIVCEYWEIPIFSGVRNIISMLPETTEGAVFPGGGSIKGDLEIIYYLGIGDKEDPRFPIPTVINIPFIDVEIGVLYKDHYGAETTWLGLCFKIFGLVLAFKVLSLLFPYVTPGLIWTAILKRHDKSKEILEILGDFDVDNGDTVSSRMYRIMGTIGNDLVNDKLDRILAELGVKLRIL